ncbi:MAG: hypothetical protein ACFFD7_01800 [Candidatus Thorarchaeota archaeon]
MILNKFKDFPSKRILYLLIIFGFLIVLLVEIFIFLPIESLVPTYGILDYEFAWNVSRVLTIFSAWGINGILQQIVTIYWDFLFIVGYVPLAFGLILIVYQISSKKVQNIGAYITITPFLTGFFDVIENILLILMATNANFITYTNTILASLSASIKFGLLFVGIIFFVGALILIIFKKIKERNK